MNEPKLVELFFNHAPVSMQSLNEDGCFIEVNSHWCQTLGYESSEVIGKRFVDFVSDTDKLTFQEKFAKFKEDGQIRDIVFNMVQKNGQLKEVSYDGHMYENPENGVKQTFCVFKDLTLTRNHQLVQHQTIVESERMVRELQENLSIGIYRVDPQGVIIYRNPTMIEMFDRGNESYFTNILSKELFVNNSDRDRLLAAADASEDRKASIEALLKRSNGETFWAKVHARAIYNQHGELLHRDGTIEDISDIKRTEAYLRQAKECAEEAGRLKSTFLANMSHEIRTPMNAILGFSELLLDSSFPAKQREEFSTLINSNGNILMNLIDDIIDISKIEAGETKVVLLDCKISTLISNLHVQFEQRVKLLKRPVELILNIEDDCQDICVLCDEYRLRQVIGNLLDNAVKFTLDGSITLGIKQKSSSENTKVISIYVEDTGIGIAPDMLKLIFEQFRQVDESPTRKFGGTGLGLYISKKLVHLMNGSIEVSSKPGKGSKFEIYLNISEH